MKALEILQSNTYITCNTMAIGNVGKFFEMDYNERRVSQKKKIAKKSELVQWNNLEKKRNE